MSNIFGSILEGFVDPDLSLESSSSYDVPEFDSYTEENCGDVLALREASEDTVGIYEAMHNLATLQLRKAYGYEVTEESFKESAKNVWDKIVNAVKSLWGKITSFFKSVANKFMAMFQSGKKFINQHRDALKKKDLSGFKFSMYPYSGLSDASYVSNVYSATASVLPKEINGTETISKETIDSKLTSTVGVDVTSDNFHEELVKKLRGGDEKKEISVSIDKIISVLDSDLGVKVAKANKKEVDKVFNNSLSAISKAKSKAANDEEGDKFVKNANESYKALGHAQSICTKVFNIWKSVYVEREKACKKCVLKALSYKKSEN